MHRLHVLIVNERTGVEIHIVGKEIEQLGEVTGANAIEIVFTTSLQRCDCILNSLDVGLRVTEQRDKTFQFGYGAIAVVVPGNSLKPGNG
jgi:hypothetical protein